MSWDEMRWDEICISIYLRIERITKHETKIKQVASRHSKSAGRPRAASAKTAPGHRRRSDRVGSGSMHKFFEDGGRPRRSVLVGQSAQEVHRSPGKRIVVDHDRGSRRSIRSWSRRSTCQRSAPKQADRDAEELDPRTVLKKEFLVSFLLKSSWNETFRLRISSGMQDAQAADSFCTYERAIRGFRCSFALQIDRWIDGLIHRCMEIRDMHNRVPRNFLLQSTIIENCEWMHWVWSREYRHVPLLPEVPGLTAWRPGGVGSECLSFGVFISEPLAMARGLRVGWVEFVTCVEHPWNFLAFDELFLWNSYDCCFINCQKINSL